MSPSPSRRLLWLPLLSALLSGGLWIWSTQLPDTVWEPSTPSASLPPPPETVAAQESPSETAPANVVAAPSPSPVPARTETPDAPSMASAAPDPLPKAAPASRPSPTPLPTEAELAGPLPQHSPEELASPPQTIPPTTAAQPTATSSLTLAEIARQPELWPKQVILLASVRFPAILKGVNVGNIQVPAGRLALVRKVNVDDTIDLELPGSQGATAKVKAQATDLIVRAQALASSKEKATQAP